MPLGAPASNLKGPTLLPQFQNIPSGHAGFGGRFVQTLRDSRTDRIGSLRLG